MAEKIQKTRDPVRRWTLITLGIIVVLFLYSIIADRMTPYTSQAVVQAFVGVAPEVSGRVLEVGVTDNQKVKAGEPLFCFIDPEPYQIALQQAEAKVASVGQTIGANTAGVTSAQERLIETRANRDNTVEQAKRVLELVEREVTPRRAPIGLMPRSWRQRRMCGKPRPNSKRRRSSLGLRAPTVRAARGACGNGESQARSGAHNRRCAIGPRRHPTAYARPIHRRGQSVLTFIDARDVWFSANFRENTLEAIKSDAPA